MIKRVMDYLLLVENKLSSSFAKRRTGERWVLAWLLRLLLAERTKAGRLLLWLVLTQRLERCARASEASESWHIGIRETARVERA